MKVSIVIPCFNEEKTIISCLDSVFNVSLSTEKEVIVVDDGSTDTTPELLALCLKKYPELRIVRHAKNQGQGAAFITGVNYATGEIILTQDADLEWSPENHEALINAYQQAPVESVVYGVRYPRGYTGLRARFANLSLFGLGGMVVTLFTNVLYGVLLRDEAVGLKVFSKKTFLSLSLRSPGFEFTPEFTAKVLRRHIPIVQVTVSYRPRTHKEGKKIRFQDGFIALWTLLYWRFARF